MKQAYVRVKQIFMYTPPFQLGSTRTLCIQSVSRIYGVSKIDSIPVSSLAHRIWDFDNIDVENDMLRITIAEEGDQYIELANIEINFSYFIDNDAQQITMEPSTEDFKSPIIFVEVQFVNNVIKSSNTCFNGNTHLPIKPRLGAIKGSISDGTILFNITDEDGAYPTHLTNQEYNEIGIGGKKSDEPDQDKRIDNELFKATSAYMKSKRKHDEKKYAIPNQKKRRLSRRTSHDTEEITVENGRTVHRLYHRHCHRSSYDEEDEVVAQPAPIRKPDVKPPQTEIVANPSTKIKVRPVLQKSHVSKTVILPRKKKLQSLNYLLNTGACSATTSTVGQQVTST